MTFSNTHWSGAIPSEIVLWPPLGSIKMPRTFYRFPRQRSRKSHCRGFPFRRSPSSENASLNSSQFLFFKGGGRKREGAIFLPASWRMQKEERSFLFLSSSARVGRSSLSQEEYPRQRTGYAPHPLSLSTCSSLTCLDPTWKAAHMAFEAITFTICGVLSRSRSAMKSIAL